MIPVATRQYLLEIDDERYRLRGRLLEKLGQREEIDGDKWVVSDFEGAAPQVMTVDSPIQYVDAVIEKRLRDSGALLGGGRVLVHRRHRRGSRATEALFVNVSSKLFAQHVAAAEDDDHHRPLFALHSLLARALDTLSSPRPAAVLLTHGRHVDVVVGSAERTFGAFRVSFHEVGGDPARVIESLKVDIERIEQENNVEVASLHTHHWLLAGPEEADWTCRLAEVLGVPHVEPKLRRLKDGGEGAWSSLPALFAKLRIDDSVSAPAERLAYRSQSLMPAAAAVLVAVTVIALAAALFWDQKARYLDRESVRIQASLTPPEPGPAVLRAAYEKPLELADTLGRAQIAPSLQNVLAQVSASVSNRITFQEVVVEYPDHEAKLEVRLVGQSEELGEGEGVPVFNAFLAALRQRGYTLVKSELKTDVNTFSFLIELERGLA